MLSLGVCYIYSSDEEETCVDFTYTSRIALGQNYCFGGLWVGRSNCGLKRFLTNFSAFCDHHFLS